MAPPNKPLVPPPPTLGGEESAAPDSPARAEATAPLSADDPPSASQQAEPSVTPATDRDGEEAFGSLIDVLHAQLGREPEVPSPIAASRRRGALPPPKTEATRASYNAGRSGGKTPPAPGVNALPSGVRPPGAPDPLEPDDTGVLIASAVAALTAGDTSDVDASAAAPSAASTPLSAATSNVTPAPAETNAPVVVTAEPPPSAQTNRRGVWIGAALLGAVAVWWLWPGAQESGETGPEPRVAAMAEVESPASRTVKTANPQPSPPEAPPVAADRLDLPTPDATAADADADALAEGGDALPEEAVAQDTNGEADLNLDPGLEAEHAEADQPDADPDEPADAAKTRSRKKKKSKTKSKPSPTAAPPSADPEPAKDGASLLAEAKAALTAGKLQNAYRLASKARGQGQRAGTLVIMAKAACRMGSESKAKKAFGQMTLSERRGIRSECRTKGIRLGL